MSEAETRIAYNPVNERVTDSRVKMAVCMALLNGWYFLNTKLATGSEFRRLEK